MGIFRSTNPTDFNAVDGIIINESAPAPNISGVASNIALLIAQFERGPVDLEDVGSIGELKEKYGDSQFSGNLVLKNKKFGRLRVVRVDATGASAGTHTFQNATPANAIQFTAKYKGAYGGLIKVTISAGSTTGSKYLVQDTSPTAVFPDETYDNVAIAAITPATFAASRLVNVSVLLNTSEPAPGNSLLGSASDGSAVDADYQAAITKTEVEASGNIVFLDAYNSNRNGYLKLSMANTQDKMAILAGLVTDQVADAITDVGNYRDADGRMIYAYPWIQTVINAQPTLTHPASWYASLLSQISPNIDPAFSANTQFLAGVTGLAVSLSRNQYISLKAAGISAFEIDSDIGPKIKSGVVTQIANSSKITVLRRRMADYLTASAAAFLKNYQNAPNSKENRTAVKGAIVNFITSQQALKILPTDKDVKSGLASLVDTESLNTDSSIAAGFFKILWRQRIFSSMRYIVLQAEIGESVVVTEGE